MSIEILGWIGATCFSACGLPQLWKCWKEGHAEGVSLLFLIIWLVGEITMFAYLYLTDGLRIQLTVNYILNIIITIAIFKYKLFPRVKVHYEEDK